MKYGNQSCLNAPEKRLNIDWRNVWVNFLLTSYILDTIR